MADNWWQLLDSHKCWRCGRPIRAQVWLWTADYRTWRPSVGDEVGEDTVNNKPFGTKCVQRMAAAGELRAYVPPPEPGEAGK